MIRSNILRHKKRCFITLVIKYLVESGNADFLFGMSCGFLVSAFIIAAFVAGENLFITGDLSTVLTIIFGGIAGLSFAVNLANLLGASGWTDTTSMLVDCFTVVIGGFTLLMMKNQEAKKRALPVFLIISFFAVLGTLLAWAIAGL